MKRTVDDHQYMYRKPIDYILTVICIFLIWWLPSTSIPLLSGNYFTIGIVALFWVVMITLTKQRKKKELQKENTR